MSNQVAEMSAKDLVEAAKAAVPVGYKQTEAGVIPEDWEVTSLQDVAVFGGGTTPPRKNYEKYYVSGLHPWVKTLDLNNSLISVTEEYVTDAALAETSLKKHPAGSVLIAMYGGFNQIGRTGLIAIDAAINQALVAVMPKKGKLVSEYLLYNFNYKVEYWKGVASSSRKDPNITSNDVKNYLLPLPTVKEQTAIANALSDVDALISELEKLIAKKQDIKNATMQQLLTGRTRLPQFALREDGTPKGTKPSELGEIPEDWGVYSLGQLIKGTQLGGNYKNSELETGHPLIKMGNLGRGYIKLDKLEFVVGKAKEVDQLEFGDLLFNTRNTLDLVGKVSVWRNELSVAFFNSNLMRITFASSLVESNFYMNAVMNSDGFVNALSDIAIGTTSVAAIYARDLFQLKVSLPPKKEQTAIATILSDMDAEIQALEQRLSKTRQIKQGMMQELLTGKTRLVPRSSADACHAD